MKFIKETLAILTALGLCASGAAAQDSAGGSISFGTSGASADASASGEADAEADAEADVPAYPAEGPWGSEAGTWEIGLYWGLFFPSEKHELYDPSVSKPNLGHHELENVTPALGLRAAYLPFRVLGLEVEGGLMPSQTKDTNQGLNIFAVRAHAMLLAPTTTIVPFLLVGGGLLAESSEPAVMGSDIDGALHVGIGAKAYVTSDVALRLDVRDNFTNGFGTDELAQHWEALLGITLVAGRVKAPAPVPPPPDEDGDGVADESDQCKGVAGVAPTGCPPDADDDGIIDANDACPNAAGMKSADAAKNGCPPPPPDCDKDGVPDELDKCPAEVGDGPDGCIMDGDADGIRDRDDKCVKEPETKNGFEDKDGCPDEVPEVVKKFTGVIEGIVFDANKATIRPTSFAKLDEAVKVLTDYPQLRMEVSGHTDTSGNADKNTKLSKDRAESVKTYFIEKGVAADRIETLGAGSTMPIGDNATKEGRAQNRRIEFKLLQ